MFNFVKTHPWIWISCMIMSMVWTAAANDTNQPQHRQKRTPHLFLYPTFATMTSPDTMQVFLRGIYYKSARRDGSAPPNRFYAKLIRKMKWWLSKSNMPQIPSGKLLDRFPLFNADVEKSETVEILLWSDGQDGQSYEFKFKIGEQKEILPDQTLPRTIATQITTNDDGYFEVVVPVLIKPATSRGHSANTIMSVKENEISVSKKGMAPSFTMKVAVPLSADGSMLMSTSVVVTVLKEKSNIMVISDIDDTIKVSDISGSLTQIVSAAFLQPYRAVTGMPELFQNWVTQAGQLHMPISFHYISGAPWKMIPVYKQQFFDELGFPPGTALFKSRLIGTPRPVVNSKTHSLHRFSIPKHTKTSPKAQKSGTYHHKMRSIQNLLGSTDGNDVTTLLVGDSTEYDPEIYADIVRLYGWKTDDQDDPGKIGCVFIHAITPLKQSAPNSRKTSVASVNGDEDEDEEDTSLPPCDSLDDTESCIPSESVVDKLFLKELVQRLERIFAGIPDFKSRVRVFRTGQDLNSAKSNFFNGKCY